MTNVAEMSRPEMAALYNTLAAQTGDKPIKEFKDKATGMRRLAAIQAKVNGGGEVSLADQIRLAQEEPDLPEDPVEAKAQLQAEEENAPPVAPENDSIQTEFGDADLPAPSTEKAPRKKRGTRKAVEVTEPVTVDVNNAESIYAGFGVRPDTNLARVVGFLVSNLDHSKPASEVIAQVYGEGKGALGPLLMVLEGVRVRIARRGLPLELRRERGEPKNPQIGLFIK